MSKRSQEAASLFKQGFSCSQSIFGIYGEALGLKRDDCLKIASGFGGGIARMGETCGAVSGALMALGYKYGQAVPDEEAKKRVYALVAEYVTKFKAKHGAIACRQLLGYDLSKPEEQKIIKDKKLTDSICPALIQTSAEILEEMLFPPRGA